MRDKFQLLILRYLLIQAALLGGYTLFNYALFRPDRPFALKDTVANAFIPMGLIILTVWFFLRPRMKILNLKATKGDWVAFYLVIAAFSFGFPLVLAQFYMESATGKLTPLSSIEGIRKAPYTRYYSVKEFYLSKAQYSAYTIFEVSGRASQNLDMHVYVVVPMMAAAEDTSKRVPAAWLGIHYDTRISNKLSDKEKEEAYHSFLELTHRTLKETDVSQFSYLERPGPSAAREGYLKACGVNDRYRSNDIILTALYDSPATISKRKLYNFLWAFFTLPVIWILMVLVPSVNEDEVERIRASRPDRRGWRL